MLLPRLIRHLPRDYLDDVRRRRAGPPRLTGGPPQLALPPPPEAKLGAANISTAATGLPTRCLPHLPLPRHAWPHIPHLPALPHVSLPHLPLPHVSLPALGVPSWWRGGGSGGGKAPHAGQAADAGVWQALVRALFAACLTRVWVLGFDEVD